MATFYIILSLFSGGAIGFWIAWVLKSKELSLERKNAEERIKNAEDFGTKFKAVAADVLNANSEGFLNLAKKDFNNTKEIVKIDLSNKEQSIEKLVKTLEEKINKFEKERSTQFTELGSEIKRVLETGAKMNESANTIKTVLSSSSAIRGRWGEAVLKNLLEESGLTEGIDFFIQETISGDESALLRPDVIVNLPGELRLAIDSKASLDDFVKAIEEKEDIKKPDHIKKFVAALRSRIGNLAGKEYQKHVDQKIPYVVMFIPGEAAVRAAFEHDPTLYMDAQAKKIMLASPATIMPLILLIAHAWRQHKTAVNAVKLSEEIVDLGNRLKAFFGHVSDIHNHLSGTVKKFNLAVGSWELRVLPKLEQINTIGGNLQIPESIQVIEEEPREAKKILSNGKSDN